MIFLDYATTGDGELTALQILDLLARKGEKASQIFGACKRFPQVLINVPMSGNEQKNRVMAADWLADAVREQEEILGSEGRVLVRASGTEALVRVMVEAKSDEFALKSAKALVDCIKLRENLTDF